MKIYLLAALILAWILWWRIKKAPNDAAKRALINKAIIYTLIGVIFLLAATGRIHWIGAAFAALLPILKFIFVWLVRVFPFLARVYSQKKEAPQPTSQKMDLAEARQILEVDDQATEEEIQTAYKRQIQKVHPDRGGSQYFAVKLNEARDLLMEELKNRNN